MDASVVPRGVDVGTDAVADVDAGRPSFCAPAGTYRHAVDVEGVTRETIVHVPPSAGADAPAVLVFHDAADTGERFFATSGWREKADEVGAVVVFPTAMTHCYHEEGRLEARTTWSNGLFGRTRTPCTADEIARIPEHEVRRAVDHPQAKDLAFIDGVVGSLPRDHCVDAKRVYSVGFGDGGVFSARLGVERSERIAAFAVASGFLAVNALAERPTAAMFHFGEVEAELPVSEAAWDVDRFRDTGKWLLRALRLEESYEFDQPVVNGVPLARLSFSVSMAGGPSTMQALVVGELPRVYPNGINHPIRMADLHWDFLSERVLE